MNGNFVENLEQRTLLAVVDPFAPVASIVRPVTEVLYHAGYKVRFNGVAFDGQDGKLDADSLRWTITEHVGDQVRVVQRLRGAGGVFVVPEDIAGTPDQFFRLRLAARDSTGKRGVDHFDLTPRTSKLTLGSTLDGVRLKLDGRRVTEDQPNPSVVGSQRLVRAPRFQVRDGILYEFVRWSDGGKRTHAVEVRFVDQTLTALYASAGPAQPGPFVTPPPPPDFSTERIRPDEDAGLFD